MFVADAASVRQQIPAMVYADASSVGHDDANLELLSLIIWIASSCRIINDQLPLHLTPYEVTAFSRYDLWDTL